MLTIKQYFTFSNIFLFCSLFILTIGQFIPVEICNEVFRDLIYIIILFGLPIVMYKKIRLLFSILTKKYLKAFLGLLVFILIGLYSFFFFVFFSFEILMPMCSYSTVKTLYIRKGFKHSSIIVRNFGCGVYDSDDKKSNEIVNNIDIFSLIRIVPNIDTSKINKNNWTKVEE